jgi:hypothetical protein
MARSTATKNLIRFSRQVAPGGFFYDQDTCDLMTDAEAETLWRLHQMQDQEFDAACDELASSLGYDKSQLSDEQRANIVSEVGDLMEDLDAADGAGRYPPRDLTPLILCLKRGRDLGLEIMNIRDAVIARFLD